MGDLGFSLKPNPKPSSLTQSLPRFSEQVAPPPHPTPALPCPALPCPSLAFPSLPFFIDVADHSRIPKPVKRQVLHVELPEAHALLMIPGLLNQVSSLRPKGPNTPRGLGLYG